MTESSVRDIPDRFELGVPAAEFALDLAHTLLEVLWSEHGSVQDADRARFETALIEIVANVVEHAYALDSAQEVAPGSERRRLMLTLGVTDSAVKGEVRDNGLPNGIDLSAVGMPEETSESGRGLAMAIACLSDLSFTRDGAQNVWSLRCDLA